MASLVRFASTLVLAGLSLAVAYVVADAGYRTISQWSVIGVAYAACGAVWLVAGPAMAAGGLWMLATLGRHRIPFALAGAGALISGVVLVAGVLAYVIPCSGPD